MTHRQRGKAVEAHASRGHDAPMGTGVGVNETCDRCGPAVSAAHRVRRGGGELFLCRHCTNSLWPALFAQGWTIWRVRGVTLVYREVNGTRRPRVR